MFNIFLFNIFMFDIFMFNIFMFNIFMFDILVFYVLDLPHLKKQSPDKISDKFLVPKMFLRVVAARSLVLEEFKQCFAWHL